MPRAAGPRLAQPFDAAPDERMWHAAARMARGWILIEHGRIAEPSQARPKRIRYILLHAEIGIALLDLAPHRTPDAARELRIAMASTGFAQRFGATPPIIYRSLPTPHLHRIGEVLELAFAMEPANTLTDAAWTSAALELLAPNTADIPAASPQETSNTPTAATPQEAKYVSALPPATLDLTGFRALRAFWAGCGLAAAGVVALLSYLGPPPTASPATEAAMPSGTGRDSRGASALPNSAAREVDALVEAAWRRASAGASLAQKAPVATLPSRPLASGADEAVTAKAESQVPLDP